MSDPIVGIDLGTSNSVVAYCDATGAVRVLSDEAGYKIHPSVVSFHPSGGVVVGAAAKQRKVIDPTNTIYSVKRLLGRTFTSIEVQTAQTRAPFQLKEGANQMPMIVTRGGDFAVPEISAIVLDHVRNIAATALDTEVSRAVVTVPASFNDAQRTATATAGAIAGITVMRVLNEPTAAALAYGHSRNLKQVIAVYDFGGGTFDITLLKLQDEVYEVLGTAGDSFLGGDDLDERIVDKMVTRFLTDHRIDLRTNEVSMMRLRAVAEQTKIELSRRSRAVVRIDEIAYGPKGVPLNLQIELTRDEFVTQVADIIDRTFPVCKEAMQLAGLDVKQIDDIILVGGTTKIPYVRDQVSKFFSKAPRTDVNPEEAVAVGAALQASALERVLTKSTKLPVPETTQADYEFGVEDESLTMPQGAKGEPTDPRAKISASSSVPDLRAKKPSSISFSAALPDDDGDIEGADTNVQPAPTADKPNAAKRASAEYSARNAPVDKFEGKQGTQPLGRITKSIPSPLGPMGKVPPRQFGAPLPPVTRMEPKVDPRLRKSDGGIGTAPTPPVPSSPSIPPRTGFQPMATPLFPSGKVSSPPVDPSEDTAVALTPASPAALPHASTMMHEVPDAPMPALTTAPGIGAPMRGPLPVPAPGIADLLPAGAGTDVDLDDAEELAPVRRPPRTFPVVPEPVSAVTLMPLPDEIDPGSSAADTGPELRPSSAGSTQPMSPPPPAPAYKSGSPTVMGRAVAAPQPSPAPQSQPAPFPFPPMAAPQQPAPPMPPVQQSAPFPPPPQSAPFPQHQRPAAQPPPPIQVPTPQSQLPTQAMAPYGAPMAQMPPPPMPSMQPVQARAPAPPAPAPAPPPPIVPVVIAPPPRAPVVLDVTPRGLGIATVAGYCEELIRRNSRLPAEQRKLFTTSRDSQESVRIIVCQGESRRIDNNIVLGELVLEAIPPRPRGETSIEVTFTLDVSGILQVRARDAATGSEQRATLDLLGAMPAEDVAHARDRLQQLKR